MCEFYDLSIFKQFWKFGFFIAKCGGQVNLMCDLLKQFLCLEIHPWKKDSVGTVIPKQNYKQTEQRVASEMFS